MLTPDALAFALLRSFASALVVSLAITSSGVGSGAGGAAAGCAVGADLKQIVDHSFLNILRFQCRLHVALKRVSDNL